MIVGKPQLLKGYKAQYQALDKRDRATAEFISNKAVNSTGLRQERMKADLQR